MHDGRPGRMRLERRCGDLLGRDGYVGVFSDRITRAGDGAGDKDRAAQHRCTLRIEPASAMHCKNSSSPSSIAAPDLPWPRRGDTIAIDAAAAGAAV